MPDFLSLPRFVVLIAVVVLFAACTSTEVVSNKAPNYTSQIESLHTTTYVSENLETLAATFSDLVRADLRSMSIQSTAKHNHYTPEEESDEGPSLEPDSSKTPPVAYDVAENNDHTHVLLLQEKSQSEHHSYTPAPTGPDGMMMGSGTSQTKQTYVFEASLYDVATQERVWRAEITTKGTKMTSQSSEAQTMADEVVDKLIEDKLLPSRPGSSD